MNQPPAAARWNLRRRKSSSTASLTRKLHAAAIVAPAEPDQASPLSNLCRAAARCWALLLVRIYECLPLRCPKCGEPMRIIAFVLDRPTIERILDHIGVIGGHAWFQRCRSGFRRSATGRPPTQLPRVPPAHSPPQLAFGFDQTVAGADWPEMDQAAGQADGWEGSPTRLGTSGATREGASWSDRSAQRGRRPAEFRGNPGRMPRSRAE